MGKLLLDLILREKERERERETLQTQRFNTSLEFSHKAVLNATVSAGFVSGDQLQGTWHRTWRFCAAASAGGTSGGDWVVGGGWWITARLKEKNWICVCVCVQHCFLLGCLSMDFHWLNEETPTICARWLPIHLAFKSHGCQIQVSCCCSSCCCCPSTFLVGI